jgi:hypothetical protein
MDADRLKTAFFAVWLILSGVILVLLCLPFVFPPEAIQAAAPVCQWKARYDVECPFCGMTRSFLLISRGEFSRASLAHGLSLYLYTALILNELAAALVLIRRSVTARRRLKIKGRY